MPLKSNMKHQNSMSLSQTKVIMTSSRRLFNDLILNSLFCWWKSWQKEFWISLIQFKLLWILKFWFNEWTQWNRTSSSQRTYWKSLLIKTWLHHFQSSSDTETCIFEFRWLFKYLFFCWQSFFHSYLQLRTFRTSLLIFSALMTAELLSNWILFSSITIVSLSSKFYMIRSSVIYTHQLIKTLWLCMWLLSSN